MKTTLLFCLMLAGFLTHASAPKGSLSGKIELPESVLPNQDIHVNLYVGINPNHPRERWGEPMQKLTIKAGKFNIDVPVGNYFISISSFNCNTFELPIVIGKNFESLSIKLTQLNIPQDIHKVDLYMLNKGEKRTKKYEMVQNGSKWIPKDNIQLEKGQQYFFILNDNKIPVYQPDKLVNFCYLKSCFQNIYHSGEIKFESYSIPQPYKASIGQWKGNSLNPKFSAVLSELDEWEKDKSQLFREFLKGELTETNTDYISFMEGFDALKIKYGNEFPQLFIEKELELMDNFSSVKQKLFTSGEAGKITIIQSEEFTSYLNKYLILVRHLNANSPYLNGEFINSLTEIDRLLIENKFTEAQKASLGFSDKTFENLFQKFLQAESPYALANIKCILGPYYSEKGEMEKGIALLNSIKTDCPYHKSIKKGTLDQEILGMKAN